MSKLSAGLLIYRIRESVLEVLIVHPGGPFWAKKDLGAWSIPKGEYLDEEDQHAAAYREFTEETGKTPPSGDETYLGEIRQPSGKRLSVWAINADFDTRGCESNTFEMEWPKNSGKLEAFREVDQIAWFSVGQARQKLLKGHTPFLDRLLKHVCSDTSGKIVEDPIAPSQSSLF